MTKLKTLVVPAVVAVALAGPVLTTPTQAQAAETTVQQSETQAARWQASPRYATYADCTHARLLHQNNGIQVTEDCRWDPGGWWYMYYL